MPALLFFLLFVIHLLRCIVQTSPLVSQGQITSINMWALALSFLATMSITLMLRRERPGLWSRTKEHLGDFHPVATVTTREKRFFRIEARERLSTLKKHPMPPTELVAPPEEWCTVVDPRREDFKKSDGNIPVMER